MPEQTFGRFRVVRTLGRGTYGVVFEALDAGSGRRVAVKVLTSSTGEDRARLLREAMVLARLRHPNVVAVLGTGTQEGVPYLVMELVEGGTLAGLIARRTETQERLLALLEQAARGLHAAHEAGCVHRDVKPDNILVDASGARVADFGLVRLDDASRLTETGLAMGTPAYMSPEMIRGDTRRVGTWSDVFSLGVVLFEVLTGGLPIRTANLLDLAHELGSPAELPRASERAPGVPPALDELARRALAKDPASRMRSARELADGIRAHLDGKTSPGSPAPPRRRRSPLLVAALAVVVAASAVTFVASRGGARPPLIEPAKYLPPPSPPSAKHPARAFPDACKDFERSRMTELSAVLGEYRLTHTEEVSAIAISRDGTLGASGSRAGDGSVRVFDIPSGKDIISLKVEGAVHTLAFTTERGLVAITDDALLVWNPTTRESASTSVGGEIESAAVSSDGLTAVLSRVRGPIEVWDLSGKEPRRSAESLWPREKRAIALAGARAILASEDKTFAFLDSRDATIRELEPLDPWMNGVTAVGISASGEKAVIGTDDGALRVIDMESGTLAGTFGPAVLAREGYPAVRALAVSPRADRVVVGSDDGSVTLYDATSPRGGSLVGKHHARVDAIAMTPDGRFAIAGDREHSVRIWDLGTRKECAPPSSHRGYVASVAFAGKGRAVSVSPDGCLDVWSLETGKRESEVDVGARAHAVAVFRDGRRAIVLGEDRKVQLRDLESGRRMKLFNLPDADDVVPVDAFALEVSPDETCFLAGTGRTMTLWSLVSGGPPRTFKLAGRERVTSVHFLPNGRALSSSFDPGNRRLGKLQLWDLESDGLPRVLDEHAAWVIDTTVSDDGHRALSGSWDGTARLWDLDSGMTLATLPGQRGVRAASFLPRERAVTVGWDRKMHIWDLRRTTELDSIGLGSACDFAATRPAVAPDGKSFLVGTARGVVLRFALVDEPP